MSTLIRRLYEDEKFTYYYIVRLITATGVRVSELITFQVEDAAAGEKDIYSKGNKVRRVYIPTRLRDSLMEWTARENRRSGTLFLNRFGRPAHRQRHPDPAEGLCPALWPQRGCDVPPLLPPSVRQKFY